MGVRIAVVDYHKGNLRSVERGIRDAGGDAFVTDNPARIAAAHAVVLPGVGSFADAAASMQAGGQMDAVRNCIEQGIPFLGICLGLHLMFEGGVEGASQQDEVLLGRPAQGLAVLPGVVQALPRHDAEGSRYKVPHVGWNAVNPVPLASIKRPGEGRLTKAACEQRRGEGGSVGLAGATAQHFASPLFAGIDVGDFFYFTHGYVAPDTPYTVATTTHSVTFPCAVQYKETAFGVQFHPEKSSDAGALLLRNFVNIVKGA